MECVYLSAHDKMNYHIVDSDDVLQKNWSDIDIQDIYYPYSIEIDQMMTSLKHWMIEDLLIHKYCLTC